MLSSYNQEWKLASNLEQKTPTLHASPSPSIAWIHCVWLTSGRLRGKKSTCCVLSVNRFALHSVSAYSPLRFAADPVFVILCDFLRRRLLLMSP